MVSSDDGRHQGDVENEHRVASYMNSNTSCAAHGGLFTYAAYEKGEMLFLWDSRTMLNRRSRTLHPTVDPTSHSVLFVSVDSRSP